ncbi:MAG: MFS transporter [Phycisphaerales bacterium]|nr:MFS transporter [Phycisphaerales bacterium]
MQKNVDFNRRTADLYQWYATLAEASFWVPVFFLYLAAYLPLDAVLILEAIYFLGVVVIEVPSGWFSDRLGRRPTMLIGGLLMAASHGLMFCGPWIAEGGSMDSGLFYLFGSALILRAGGMAFRSGTDTALHYDALLASGSESEFAPREARASRRRFYGAAAAALVGGLVALIDLRAPYLLSFCAAIGIVIVVLRMREPTLQGEGRSQANLIRQIGSCIVQWRNGMLLLLFLYAAMMIVLNHIPYEYFQPYIETVLGESGKTMSITPAVAGIHVAVTFWIAGWLSARSIRLRDRFGLWAVLLMATAMQTLLIGLMWMWVSVPVMILLLFRSCPRALMTPPLNAAVTGAVPTRVRATYLSLQSLAGRLSFSGVLVLLTLAVPMSAKADWSTIHVQIGISAVAAIACTIAIGMIWMIVGRGTSSQPEG